MKTLYALLIVIVLIGCRKESNNGSQPLNTNTTVSTIAEKIANLKDAKNKEVIVVAHRGDWRNAPENSLQAIQNCIEMNVDMIEIDVQETKDGQLVLMHDKTIDRTTTGTGTVKEWTLDSLLTLRLRDGLGVPTTQKIPTLREALTLSKNKILVNLDKSYDIFDKCYEIILETGTQDEVIIKGNKSKTQVEKEFGKYLDKVHFMPIINLENSAAAETIADYMDENQPVAIEFVFKTDTVGQISNFKELREAGTSVWVNALWPRLCGDHDDEKAVLDPTVYDWYLNNNVDIIQTDRPKLLIDYLKNKGLHK
ncbi:glycerophosphodiester phosphodiesterase family protein [Spongiimicrobium sp. 3-5]|uniref:glycerophosphodiester phosphodiesterase family protein n=1 Tax=Spongiimicrobium sp. 3-5 TaxID=3332596 RepID=UPI003980E7A4